MRTKFYLVAIMGLLLVSGCRKAEKSYCNSACARCGRHRHVETKSGVTIRDDTCENDISQWLSAYRSNTCSHVWIRFSGGSSKGIIWAKGLHWDGVSYWDICLRYIKQLQSAVGEPVTRQLLKRYYSMLETAYGPEDDDKPITPGINLQIYEKVKEFSEELKAKLGPIDNEEKPEH